MTTRSRRSFFVCAIVHYFGWAVFLLRMSPEEGARGVPALPPGGVPLSRTGGPPASGVAGQDWAPALVSPEVLARVEQ
jgi:hypothetical protein